MEAIPLCRANAILPFLKFLNQTGFPTEQLLQNAHVPIFVLENPEALIPLHQTCLFIEQAARLEKIDNIGIRVGQQTQISDLGLLGQLLSQCQTLGELLTLIEQMMHTYNSGEQVWMVEDGDRVWLHHRYKCPATIGTQQAGLHAVVLLLKVFHLFLECDWRPLAVHLEVSFSETIANTELFSNIPIVFNQPYSAIVFPKSLLRLPRKQTTQFNPSMRQRDYDFLLSSAPSLDFFESLRQLVRSLLPDGYPDIDQVAELTGISKRSLQRRLAEDGLNYSQIVDQARFGAATHLLKDTNTKLIDISISLGYNDAANFTRAFKRWAGISPCQFRFRYAHR